MEFENITDIDDVNEMYSIYDGRDMYRAEKIDNEYIIYPLDTSLKIDDEIKEDIKKELIKWLS